MVDAKEAVKIATEYIRSMFTPTEIPELRLEEVDLTSADIPEGAEAPSPNPQFWEVTFSYIVREPTVYLSLGDASKIKDHKVLKIDTDTGKLISMKSK